MFYQCGDAVKVGYARSDDGLNWERPLFNATDFSAHVHEIIQGNDTVCVDTPPEVGEGETLTNLVAGFHMPSVMYDPDSPLPYKMFAFGEGGYHSLASERGQRFRATGENPVIPMLAFKNEFTGKTWVSDVAPCYKDRHGYTAMIKTYEVDVEERTRRCVGRAVSEDLNSWSEVETVWIPGPAEDEIARARGFSWADFYGLCPFPYGEGYLGMLWLFEIDREFKSGTNLGKMEVFLAYSPDGKQWRRLSDEPFIPWDLNFGEQGGMVTTASTPIFEDNEIKLYYSDSNYVHGCYEEDYTGSVVDPAWVTRCARIPKERLVGATSTSGRLVLKPSAAPEGRLRLNIDSRGGVAEISISEAGDSVASFRVENQDESDLWLTVPFGEVLELSITLKNATLYALELR
ncbi:hypothetical protein OLMES_1268 [Oleiphilus messinensis]|uniref:Glycosyl hydrolase family 32 N-terminal domain-containing protein n=2 Tax=Oleiphilus messinensis TaxID=141451 RepID=A0A1Y0I535_9GAMM|nr:hypothetical protein OLMES_1268 [Oleiphilus messinensis]